MTRAGQVSAEARALLERVRLKLAPGEDGDAIGDTLSGEVWAMQNAISEVFQEARRAVKGPNGQYSRARLDALLADGVSQQRLHQAGFTGGL